MAHAGATLMILGVKPEIAVTITFMAVPVHFHTS